MLWTASCSVSRSMVNCHVQCFQKLLFWLLILRDAPHSVGKDDFQLDFFLIDPGVPSDGKNQARCATKTNLLSTSHTITFSSQNISTRSKYPEKGILGQRTRAL